MKRSTASIDRLIALLISAVLIVGGLLAILWKSNVHWARTVFAHAEPRWYNDAPQQAWWDWALLGATILTALLGLWLLLANLRPNRVGNVNLAGSDALGSLSASPQQIGNAVASNLERRQDVRKATAKTTVDRGQRTLRITMVADPETPLNQLRGAAAQSAQQIDDALEGSDVATQFFVEYEQPGRTD